MGMGKGKKKERRMAQVRLRWKKKSEKVRTFFEGWERGRDGGSLIRMPRFLVAGRKKDKRGFLA